MSKISRNIVESIKNTVKRGKSILLLGPRQVGKTTLLNELPIDLAISIARPALRQRYEENIESFSQEVEALADKLGKKPLVAVDEIQKIPDLMDATQDLIDRNIAQFILTGSSARKLKKQQQVNWLPGRVVYFQLDGFNLLELPKSYINLDKILQFGCLPGIVLDDSNDSRQRDLESYVVIYLEEEVRQEALVRQLRDFSRFLHLAASKSGQLSNFNNLASDIGVAQTTIAAYYQILEDCLITERIEPYLKKCSVKRRLVKSCKYLFFDLGVMRVAARENIPIGSLFEQFIGLELLHLARSQEKRITLNFWRDLEGREVDWILSYKDQTVPIEVKYTENPTIKDARHLKTFLADYNIKHGYIVCRCDKARKLDSQITALPWQDLNEILN